MVRVAQWCECTSCHWNVQLNMVKTVCVILCDFYHNEKKIFFKHPNSSTYPRSFFLEFAYEKTLTEQAETTTSPSGPFCSFLDPPPLCLIVSLHPKLPFQFSFHQKSPFYQNAAPSVCQVSLRNLLSVRFPSGIFFFLSDFPLKSPSFCQISLRNLLSVRFPSEIFFLSGFLQKAPSLCQFPLRNLLLSVRSQKYPSLC